MQPILIKVKRIQQVPEVKGYTAGIPNILSPAEPIDYKRVIKIDCDGEFFYVYYKPLSIWKRLMIYLKHGTSR